MALVEISKSVAPDFSWLSGREGTSLSMINSNEPYLARMNELPILEVNAI